MNNPNIFAGGIGLILILFLVIMAILWFLLPFAVFGIKDLLKQNIAELKKLNSYFERYDKNKTKRAA